MSPLAAKKIAKKLEKEGENQGGKGEKRGKVGKVLSLCLTDRAGYATAVTESFIKLPIILMCPYQKWKI